MVGIMSIQLLSWCHSASQLESFLYCLFSEQQALERAPPPFIANLVRFLTYLQNRNFADNAPLQFIVFKTDLYASLSSSYFHIIVQKLRDTASQGCHSFIWKQHSCHSSLIHTYKKTMDVYSVLTCW